MRKLLFLLFVGFQFFGFAQEQKLSTFSSLDINYFAENIALHNDDILHLIKDILKELLLVGTKKHLVSTLGNNVIITLITEFHSVIRI